MKTARTLLALLAMGTVTLGAPLAFAQATDGADGPRPRKPDFPPYTEVFEGYSEVISTTWVSQGGLDFR